jgi:predicted Zn finger-like uncharacterized protein
MLFTRCPDCRTTFRVTVEILKKADGQVRCGRCASVFNGFSELTEREADDASPNGPTSRRDAANTVRAEAAGPESAAEATQADGTAAIEATQTEPAPSTTDAAGAPATDMEAAAEEILAEPQPTDAEPPIEAAEIEATNTEPAPVFTDPTLPPEEADETAAEDIPVEARPADAEPPIEATQTEPAPSTTDAAGAPETATEAAAEEIPAEPVSQADAPEAAISADEVDKVLESPPAEPAELWSRDAGGMRHRPHGVVWSVAAGLAALTLAAQVAHHYRADLVRHELIGPALQAVYRELGMPVEPHWVPEEYEVVSWETRATSNPGAPDSLHFAASIRNLTSQPVAFPIVHLNLTNRWQDSVGARFFYPAEYTAADWRPDAMMPPNGTIEAQLDLLDPGPEAYGFEVDLCVELAADEFSCKSDSVFQK